MVCKICGCGPEPGRSFHKFPINSPTLLKQWLALVPIKNYTPIATHHICGDHFTEDCFYPRCESGNNTYTKLKPDSVPTILHKKVAKFRASNMSSKTHLHSRKESTPSAKKRKTCSEEEELESDDMEFYSTQKEIELDSESDIFLPLLEEKVEVIEEEDLLDLNDDIDFTNVCRICTSSTSSDSIDIFGPISKKNNLLAKIKQHLPIQLPKEGDDMPTKICSLCIGRLDMCHSIAELAVRSETLLRKSHGLRPLRKRRTAGRKYADSSDDWSGHSSEYDANNEEINSDSEESCSIFEDFGSNDEGRNTPQGMFSDYPTIASGEISVKVAAKKRESNQQIPCKLCHYNGNSTTILTHYLDTHNKDYCNLCNAVFDAEELFKHKEEKHKHICKFCHQHFSLHSLLSKHVSTQHKEIAPVYANVKFSIVEKENCTLCNYECMSKVQAKKHYFVAHQLYACDFCMELFSNSTLQTEHTSQIHMVDCKICEESFYSTRRLSKHENLKHREISSSSLNLLSIIYSPTDMYKCNICKKGLPSKVDVKRHNYWCHKIYTCEFCLEEFQNAELEDSHFETIHGTLCYFCETEFCNVEQLMDHLKSDHSDKKLFCCEYCGLMNLDREDIKVHRVMHQFNSRGDEYICPLCGKSSKTKQHFENHVRFIHLRHKYQCKICNKKFAFDYQLSRHMSVKHSNTKPYKCLDCNLSYNAAHQLKRHMKIHNVEPLKKKLLCELCNETFLKKRSLHNHIKSIHSVPTIYSCNVCHIIFATQDGVVAHVTSHTTAELSKCATPFRHIRAYKCDICNQVYSTKRVLTKHITGHIKTRQIRSLKNKDKPQKRPLCKMSTLEILERVKKEAVKKKMFINGGLVSIAKEQVPPPKLQVASKVAK